MADICREHGISEATFLHLEEEVFGTGPERAARDCRQLREENSKLSTWSRIFRWTATSAGDRAKKAVRPRHRRELGRRTQTVFALSTRRVSGLMMINRSTMNYRSRRDPQHALRVRMRELAASRVRFGYRRLTVMLRREGWAVNAKRIYRLYTEDGLAVRTKMRKKIARRSRVPALSATRPNEKWSMDFVAARLLDGRWFRVLTVVDQFTRECLLLLADSSLTGQKVALALSQVIAARGAPLSITVDNVLRQQSRSPSEQRSPVACGASGFDSAIDRWGAAWSANSLRCGGPQGFARCARRPTPPLTAASASAEQVVSREPRLPS